MKKSIKVVPKKRGRPATGRDPLVTTRMSVELIRSIDNWATGNNITRSEAMRRLVELSLAAPAPKRKRAKSRLSQARS
jgi:hypothetical protein